jgi:hypothetical protein
MTIFTGVLLFLFVVSVYKVPTQKTSKGFMDRFNAILDDTATLFFDVCKYYISTLSKMIDTSWKWMKNLGPPVNDNIGLMMDVSKSYLIIFQKTSNLVFSIVGSLIYDTIVFISHLGKNFNFDRWCLN